MANSTIKRKWDQADAAESKAESLKWEVARLLSEANDAGRTLSDLAEEVERNRSTVGRWVRVHREFAVHGNKPEFNRALEEAQGLTREGENSRIAKAKARAVVREDPEAIADVIASAPPEAREKALRAVADHADLRDEVVDAVFTPANPTKPPPTRHRSKGNVWSGIIQYIDNARRGMLAGLQELKDHPDQTTPDEVRQGLADRTRAVMNAGELLLAYLEGDDMFSEIEDFLAAQGAESEE